MRIAIEGPELSAVNFMKFLTFQTKKTEEFCSELPFIIASERDTIRGVQIQAGAVYVYIYTHMYVYIYVWRYMKHNSSACHIYVMWAQLGHCHFLYVPEPFQT